MFRHPCSSRSRFVAVARPAAKAQSLPSRTSTSCSLPVGAHKSVVGADQGFRAASGDQESVRDSVHEDSASAPIAAGQRPRPSFRHPQAREYVRGDAHTNGIESLWSMFKRGYMGTYHQMSKAHLHRYVNEFTGRHNIRPLDTADQMSSVAVGMVGKRLRYDDLIATPEPITAGEPW